MLRAYTPPVEYKWKILMVAWFVNLSIWTGDIVLAVLGTPITQDFGISKLYFSFLLSLPILMMVILGLPVGVLIARIGPKRTALLGLTIAFIAAILRSIAQSSIELTVYIALYGVGMAIVFPNLPKIAESSFPKKQQGLAAGIYMSGLPAGAILGLAASSILIHSIQWRSILQIYAFLLLIGAVLWFITAKDIKEGKVNMLRALKKVTKNKFLWKVSFANLTLLITYFGATQYFPSQEQLVDYLGTYAPILVAMISVALILGLLLLPSISSKFGEKRSLIIYQLIVASLLPVFALLIILHNPLVWVISLILGFLIGGIIPLYFAFLSYTGVEREYFGIASGIFVSILNIGGFLAPILSELMDSLGGIWNVALLFSVSSIVGALISFFFK
jgi:MFS family permease